jgi:hypothetical protein
VAGIGPILRLLGKLDRRDAFIAVFLAVQIALPLHYYMGYSDPYDERFAWRMFSPTRMARCSFQYVADDEVVRAGKEFHQAWLQIVQRGRRNVVEALAMAICDREGVEEVTLRLECRNVDGEVDKLASGGFNLCALGGL